MEPGVHDLSLPGEVPGEAEVDLQLPAGQTPVGLPPTHRHILKPSVKQMGHTMRLAQSL
jgi:hypothetical protein